MQYKLQRSLGYCSEFAITKNLLQKSSPIPAECFDDDRSAAADADRLRFCDREESVRAFAVDRVGLIVLYFGNRIGIVDRY